MWVSLNKKTADSYGKIVYKLTLNRQLRLINLQSGIFQLHLMDQLNMKYDQIDDDRHFINHYKARIMSTLGLPNTNEIIRVFGQPKCQYDNELAKHLTVANVPYFQHERFSKYENDQLLMTELQNMVLMDIYLPLRSLQD
jgi:hypothetical protein